MARNTTIEAPGEQWVEITGDDVELITFQTIQSTIYVQATTGAAPTDLSGSVVYSPGSGERNVYLSDVWPGVTGAVRVFVYAEGGSQVFVSHA